MATGLRRQHGVEVGRERPLRRRLRRGAADRTIRASAATGSPSADEQRIDVDLGDLRVVGGDLRDGLHDRDQRAAVDGRLAAERAEQSLAADQIGELGDIALGAGGNGKGDVAEHLGHRAAEAEGDDGSERGVTLHADHELAAAGDHLLDQHRLEGVAGALRERAYASASLIRRPQVEDRRAGSRSCAGSARRPPSWRRGPERRREVGGLTGGVDEAAGGDRDAVGGQDLLGGGFVERRAARPRAPSRRSRASRRARRGPRLASRLLSRSPLLQAAHLQLYRW